VTPGDLPAGREATGADRVIGGRTGVLGVIGDPVEHTLSPALQGAALAATGLDYVYVPFRVRPPALAAAIAGMRALQIRGLNVTVPHKPAVVELMDDLAPEARAVGAVNTAANQDGRLIGHNTDAFGATQSLRHDLGLDRLPPCVALLGAGGAARAILYALLSQPEVERVILANRTVRRAEALGAAMDRGGRVAVTPLEACRAQLREAGLLINATSVGMWPQAPASPLPDPSGLHPGMAVLDTVYRPAVTELMRQAGAAGARAVNGLGMLVYQGARSFEIWTGQWPPVAAMRRAAETRLAQLEP
jgi:shikimate dehydrogenase